MTIAPTFVPNHVGIIPDGNRRFATWHGLTIDSGYRAGASRAIDFVGWCLAAGIRRTSWYGSSALNVSGRPSGEVIAIHRGVLDFAEGVMARFGAHVRIIGDVDGLPDSVPGKRRLSRMTEPAGDFDGPTVQIAVNYHPAYGSSSPGKPSLDLVIRTGGQQRLSGFLPIECAFADLWFVNTLWPAVEHVDFLSALSWFGRQERPVGE